MAVELKFDSWHK